MRVVDPKALRAACERLPFFPLPGVVLLPGMQLPLHIFEPRYRQMLSDALAGPRAFAMVQPLATADPRDPSPPICPVAGLGWIVDHASLPDGRSHIILDGVARVHLDEIPSGRLYRTARGEPLADQATAGTETRALVFLGMQIATRVRRLEPRFGLTLPPGLDAGAICDHLAARLIGDPAVRQQVLEALDVRKRVELVSTALASLLHELPGGDGPVS